MYTLNLTADQVKLVHEALMDLPAKHSWETLQSIRSQVDAQNNAALAASATKEAQPPGTEAA